MLEPIAEVISMGWYVKVLYFDDFYLQVEFWSEGKTKADQASIIPREHADLMYGWIADYVAYGRTPREY
jgi:hypothetical protein